MLILKPQANSWWKNAYKKQVEQDWRLNCFVHFWSIYLSFLDISIFPSRIDPTTDAIWVCKRVINEQNTHFDIALWNYGLESKRVINEQNTHFDIALWNYGLESKLWKIYWFVTFVQNDNIQSIALLH